MDGTPASDADIAARRRWLRVLGLADTEALSVAWDATAPRPTVETIRGPEAGLVMLRARADAAGDRFNLGEATVARATVRLSGAPLSADVLGTSYVLGTDTEHAYLAAVFDGLLGDEHVRPRVLAEVIEPLARAQADRDRTARAEARSTLVDFFTVSREHA